MRLFCCAILVGCAIVTSLSGCEGYHDQAVVEWVDSQPPSGKTGVFTPPDEMAKVRSFNPEKWLQQGRALSEVEERIDRLFESHDRRLDREKALSALYDIGTPRSVPTLLKCLHNEDLAISLNAMLVLEHLGVANDDILGALAQCLNTGDSTSVRAAYTLGRLFGKNAIETIEDYQKERASRTEEIDMLLKDLKNGDEVGTKLRAALRAAAEQAGAGGKK
jgi:hypothetical protein